MEITRGMAQDILITAVEGGIDYWAVVYFYDPEEGIAWIAVDEDPDERYLITTEKIQSAVPELVESGQVAGWILEGLPDDVDSVLADCIIQWACFGEVIFS